MTENPAPRTAADMGDDEFVAALRAAQAGPNPHQGALEHAGEETMARLREASRIETEARVFFDPPTTDDGPAPR